jgi:N4-gp56 family major capsid protein
MAMTTTTTLSAPVQKTLATRMLSIETPDLIHNVPAMKERLPMGGGTTIVFRRPIKLNPAFVPLGNSGATPPSSNLRAIDIEAKPDVYGSWLEINEQVNN